MGATSSCCAPAADVEEKAVGDIGCEGAVAGELQALLEEHPYLRPTGTEPCPHPLLFWVRRCRERLASGQSLEAGMCLNRVQVALRREQAQQADAFRRFDVDSSGKLDVNEFKLMCAYIGWGEEEAKMMDVDHDSFVTLDEFQRFVGHMGGLQQLFERRRARVAAKQWGMEARATIEVGSRVRSCFHMEDGRKSSAWREAQVLAVGVRGPSGITDGVMLAFFGPDETSRARQVVPPSWIFSDQHDAAVVDALRETGILDDQQAFWASIFPVSEMRAVERLVPCQRRALANVRGSASELHDSALPGVRERFQSLGFDESDLQSVLGWIQDLAPMVIHVHLDKVGRFLETDEFYRNQFETGTSCGALDDGNQIRKDWEAELFGKAYEDAKPFERCKYGALNIMNDFRGETSAYQYGDSYLVLKDVRLRATFAAEDSGGIEGSRLAVLDQYAHVLGEYSDQELRSLVDVAQSNTSLVDPCRVQPRLVRGKIADPVFEWVTMGFPDLPQRRGRFFFEVRLLPGCSSPQVGLLSTKFECIPGESSQKGVGDDEDGWAADGQHAMLWHGGRQFPWGALWPSERKKLTEQVIVGVAVDIDEQRLFFASNGQWEEAPSFGPNDLPKGLALYPAVSLLGRAAFNFGPNFKHPPPTLGFMPWPGAPEGVCRVDTPMLGDAEVLGDYKEIQIHGEVSLKRNVQRLVVNRKYRELTKQRRSYNVNVSGTGGACDGSYSRAGVRGKMPLYKAASGASIYWHAEAQHWRMDPSEDSERPLAFAPAAEGGKMDLPTQGWEVPSEFRGTVAEDAFTAALLSGGMSEEDCKKLTEALAGEDSQGQRLVFRSGKASTFEAEWEKLADPPMNAEAAWALAVAEVQRSLLTELGMPEAVVVETPHPYEAKSHSWTRELSIDGASSLSVYFATQCMTYDSCAPFEIHPGGLMKASAGVGARVQFRSLGDEEEDEVQQLRGTVCERSPSGSCKVQIDRGDLVHTEDYKEMMSEDIRDYFAMCPDEHRSMRIEYTDEMKVADEISGFYLDREYPLTPFRVKGFNGPGPAQKQGVQAGWFLDMCQLFSGPSADKFTELNEEDAGGAGDPPDPAEDAKAGADDDVPGEAGDPPETAPGEPITCLSEVCGNPEACLRQLERLRNISGVTLVFTNGLKTKLLPTANVTYPEGTTVGDEIEEFGEHEGTLQINNFKATGPAQEAGVQIGWCLQRQQTLRQSKAGQQVSEEDLVSDPKALLEKSGVTLVFEPPDVITEPCFMGYCGDWTSPCTIPSSGCTCTFRTDGDGVDYPDRRWGVFAVILPHGSSQPAQDSVDQLARRWSEATVRASGIRGSVSIMPEDWDEARLRALCARHGWEFEWMTEDGERRRRIGDLQARRNAANASGGKPNSVWWRLEAAATQLRGKLWQPELKSNEKVEMPEPDVVEQEGADPVMGAVDVSGLQLVSRPARENIQQQPKKQGSKASLRG